MKRSFPAAFLAAALATSFATPVATAAEASATKVSRYQAGYYHFKLGDFEIAALSDGTLPIPTLQLLTNTQPGEVAPRGHVSDDRGRCLGQRLPDPGRKPPDPDGRRHRRALRPDVEQARGQSQ